MRVIRRRVVGPRLTNVLVQVKEGNWSGWLRWSGHMHMWFAQRHAYLVYTSSSRFPLRRSFSAWLPYSLSPTPHLVPCCACYACLLVRAKCVGRFFSISSLYPCMCWRTIFFPLSSFYPCLCMHACWLVRGKCVEGRGCDSFISHASLVVHDYTQRFSL